MKTNTKTILLFIMSFALIAIIGVSYAYFSASIVNNEVKDQVVETGTLSLRYVDGPEVVMQNIKPGQTITKTVYVANTGTLDAVYNLVWQELTNEITNDEMLIEGTCTRMNATTETEDGTCDAITSASISSNTIKSKITIEPSIVHKYDLTITFKDTNAAQNYNQGKKFSGVLGIEETKGAIPKSFETDDWSTIVAAVKQGKTESYNIGDLRTITLGDYGNIKLRIANKSTPSECSAEGFSQTACGFVLEFQRPIMETNMTQTIESGWPSSAMRTFINDKIYNALPDEIKNSIIDTNVVTENDSSIGSGLKSTDKIYLISAVEVFGPTFASQNNVDGEHTRQMDYYVEKGVTVTSGENASKADIWILRSMSSANDGTYYCISMYGNTQPCGGTSSILVYLAPAFRIG